MPNRQSHNCIDASSTGPNSRSLPRKSIAFVSACSAKPRGQVSIFSKGCVAFLTSMLPLCIAEYDRLPNARRAANLAETSMSMHVFRKTHGALIAVARLDRSHAAACSSASAVDESMHCFNFAEVGDLTE